MTHPVEFDFRGQAGEYFRIWIVNVMLTILTLGIYSAWAKVRTKRYFYGNSILDGSPFEYTASPVAILKGRLVVALILVIYVISTHFYPASEALFILLFFIALPWLIMRSLMFNARYSSYRNLHFGFRKSLGEAVKIFIGFGLLIPLTLGAIYPYYMHATQQYRVDHHQFGKLGFELQPAMKGFYKTYLLATLLFVGGIVVMMAILQGKTGSLSAYFGSDSEQTPTPSPAFLNVIIATTLAYLLIYLLVFAYIRAKIFNLVWCNTHLNKKPDHSMLARGITVVRFRGDVSPWKLFWIYLSNTIAIIATVGLMIPWAKIRLARYRIEHLSVAAITDLHVIAAKEREQVGTIGSEMGDILDIDIGI